MMLYRLDWSKFSICVVAPLVLFALRHCYTGIGAHSTDDDYCSV